MFDFDEIAEDEDDIPEWGGLKPPKRRGKFSPTPTGRPRLPPWSPKLQELPQAKLRNITPWAKHLKFMDKGVFESNVKAIQGSIEPPHRYTMPGGYFYPVQFPFNLELLRQAGATFLTRAFQAAGTLPRDNTVTEMEAEEFVGGGACRKAVIKCKYGKPDDALHTRLFVKYSHYITDKATLDAQWSSHCVMNNDGPELDFARMLSAGAPMRCPKYYFGDICLKTGKFILITEALDVPDDDADFGPMELEPIPHKSVDYLLDDPFAYYAAMLRSAAKLAAWGKTGKLGADIMQVIPPPQKPAVFSMGAKAKIKKYLKFVTEVAPHLFPPDFVDGNLEATLYETLPAIEKAQKDIYDYLFVSPEMCGLSHQNMNIDNAFFWRGEDGNVESGFIDWGRFNQDNYAQAIFLGLMCSDLCEFLQESDRRLLQVFAEEQEAAGGPPISLDTMWEHYMLVWCVQSLFLVGCTETILMHPHTGPEDWATITSYKDPRVYNMPNTGCGWVAMVRQFTWYWKYKDLPAQFAKWRAKNPAKTKA